MNKTGSLIHFGPILPTDSPGVILASASDTPPVVIKHAKMGRVGIDPANDGYLLNVHDTDTMTALIQFTKEAGYGDKNQKYLTVKAVFRNFLTSPSSGAERGSRDRTFTYVTTL